MTTINDDYKKLLFYANSLIATILKSTTISNKNYQIQQIKNEFNRRVVLLQKKYLEEQRPLIREPTAATYPISPIPNNIMLIITPKH